METNILAKKAASRSALDHAAAMPSPANGVEGKNHLTGAVATVVMAQTASVRRGSGSASDDMQDECRGKARAPKPSEHDAIGPSADKKQMPRGAKRMHDMPPAKGLPQVSDAERRRAAGGQLAGKDADPSQDQGAASLTIGDMNLAAAFDVVMEKNSGEREKATADVRPSRPGDDGLAGKHGARDLLSMESASPVQESRVEYLAMVAAPGSTTLAPPQLGKTTGLRALRPKSRVECERRCGSDGFCDPSDAHGCGGEYCIRLGMTELF
ncbi:hypothetical protein D3870_21220 [Noviherbaspirillum cavernae]|uniref:Uncharacterized protein n=1 Tax=Noviherbaspirillum cavernae TaxID=2320862 RepID=A0A418WW74_9BURK|nr:hypothetical protein [Noviherbaspirillum cavernae]RJF96898.1 hypothetical protein D3870_21220 [Noviherbaspirillum cavernae]